MRLARLPSLLLFLIVIMGAGFLSGELSHMPVNEGWYQGVNKSPLTPPDMVFPIVWGVLYLFMGISAWLVWLRRPSRKGAVNTALIVFGVQFLLNLTWPYIFFGLRSYIGGFIDIAVLLAVLSLTIYLFYELSKTAAFLLIPYWVWGVFAGYLNLYIVLNN